MRSGAHDPSKPINGKRPAFRKDQYGRTYWNMIEVKTNAGVSYWKPVKWSSPWKLPNEFLKELPDDETGSNRLFADVQRFIDVMMEARDEWDKNAQTAMRVRHSKGYRLGMPIDEDIRLGLGEIPGPLEPWVAMQQGNPYALGWDARTGKAYQGPPDERLVPFLPRKKADQKADRHGITDMDFSVPADGPSLAEDLEARLDLEAEVDPENEPHTSPVRRRGKSQRELTETAT